MLSAPIMNACASALFFRESISPWSLFGGALVIASSALTLRGEKNKYAGKLFRVKRI
jgi:drug/metabolite transporter (DMT)-like permease